MASDIDETFPPDNVQVAKSGLRENFLHAKEEIEELQRKTSVAWRIATNQMSI